MTIQETCSKILQAIEEGEKEYCFDPTYTDDILWQKEYKNETRQQAFDRVMDYWENLYAEGTTEFLNEVLITYGDRFDYIIDVEKYLKTAGQK